ncbi:hypothetical protein AF75_03300 [Aliarcobacter butzleri L350]|uniref:Uncharacterized protein n=1 Tax=Aliarcobacter butzleri L351 TaxID=1447259 RepID=A0A837J7L3_9BACT|nr:hypothetical protein AF76_02100 [Aliarcobacter butzleri L351]KLE13513.1 hypothetical protein AF75_03300 [Aliarcobacter butzleri L350]
MTTFIAWIKNPTKSIENLNSFILKAKIETKVSYLSDTKL